MVVAIGGDKDFLKGFCSIDFVVDLFGLWACSGQCNWRGCACFSQLLGRSRPGSANSAVISLQHCENAFSTNCNGPPFLNLKTTPQNISIERGTPQIHYTVLKANLNELRYAFWVDYDLAYLTITKYYDLAHVWIWKHTHTHIYIYIWSRVTTKCKGSCPYRGPKSISFIAEIPTRIQKMASTEHFWTFICRSAWQAQGIVHRVKSEQNVRVLWHF